MCEQRSVSVQGITLEGLADFIDLAKSSDAGCCTMVIRDGNQKPLCAIAIIDGEDTQDVLDAINEVTDSWS